MSDTKGKQNLQYKGLCVLCLLVYWRQFQPWVTLNKIKVYVTAIFAKVYLAMNFILK